MTQRWRFAVASAGAPPRAVPRLHQGSAGHLLRDKMSRLLIARLLHAALVGLLGGPGIHFPPRRPTPAVLARYRSRDRGHPSVPELVVVATGVRRRRTPPRAGPGHARPGIAARAVPDARHGPHRGRGQARVGRGEGERRRRGPGDPSLLDARDGCQLRVRWHVEICHPAMRAAAHAARPCPYGDTTRSWRARSAASDSSSWADSRGYRTVGPSPRSRSTSSGRARSAGRGIRRWVADPGLRSRARAPALSAR